MCIISVILKTEVIDPNEIHILYHVPIVYLLSSSVALQSLQEPWPPHTGGYVILLRHFIGLLRISDQSSQMSLHRTTQHRNTRAETKKNIHASIGIRTHDPSNHAATGTGQMSITISNLQDKSIGHLQYLLHKSTFCEKWPTATIANTRVNASLPTSVQEFTARG
jgi:hypothetical protein